MNDPDEIPLEELEAAASILDREEIKNLLKWCRAALPFVSMHQPEYRQLETAIKRAEEYFELGIKHMIERSKNAQMDKESIRKTKE